MTEAEFSRMFTELAQTAATLNQESDSINGILESFQKKLAALNVGIDASVALEPDLGTLWWTKSDDGWQLSFQPRGVRYSSPVLEHSRDVRIAALEELPNLVQGLKWKADEAVRAIQKAKDFVK